MALYQDWSFTINWILLVLLGAVYEFVMMLKQSKNFSILIESLVLNLSCCIASLIKKLIELLLV